MAEREPKVYADYGMLGEDSTIRLTVCSFTKKDGSDGPALYDIRCTRFFKGVRLNQAELEGLLKLLQQVAPLPTPTPTPTSTPVATPTPKSTPTATPTATPTLEERMATMEANLAAIAASLQPKRKKQ